MTIKFDIKIDLHKKLMGFECRKCSTVTTKKKILDDSIIVICPQCQSTKTYHRRPTSKNEKQPLSWLISDCIA